MYAKEIPTNTLHKRLQQDTGSVNGGAPHKAQKGEQANCSKVMVPSGHPIGGFTLGGKKALGSWFHSPYG